MTRSVMLSLGVAAAIGAFGGSALADGNAAEGEKVFRKLCSACHVVQAGQNKLGPSLHAILGRKAGTVDGFRYSDANKNSAVVWTSDKLDPYLKDPKAFMPGNRMAFAGVKKDDERKDLIAYLASLK